MISGTLRAKERADACRFRGEKVLDGGLGESPVGPPQCVRDMAALEMLLDTFKYTSCHGSPKLQTLMGTDRIITANALKELLAILQLSFLKLHPDGIVVFLVPHWPTYADQAKLFKIPTLSIEPLDVENYKMTPEALLRHQEDLAQIPHLVIFNNPCNPSGAVYSPQEVEKLAEAFTQLNSVVVADNIYAELAFEGPTTSLSQYYTKTIDTTSLSKALGCGGWRYGWAKFPPELDELFRITKQYASTLFTCPSSNFQKIAETMVERTPELLQHWSNVRSGLETTFRQIIVPALASTKLKFSECRGGWYTLLDFSAYQDSLHAQNIKTSGQLVELLFQKHRVVMVEGSEFGFTPDHLIVRYSFVDFRDGTTNHIKELCLELQKFCAGM